MNARDAMRSANDDRPVVDTNPGETPMDGRMLLSSLAATAAPGLLFMGFLLPGLVSDSRSGEDWLFACLLVGFAMLVALGYVAMLGIPYVLVLLKIGRFRWLPMALGGFAMGYLPTFCFSVLPFLFHHYTATGLSGGSGIVLGENMRLPLFAGGFGALSALVFHITYRWLSRGRRGRSPPVSEAKTT